MTDDDISYEDFAPQPQRGAHFPKLEPRVESSVRSASIRIYLHPGSDDYDACCQIVLYGPRAWLHSITGAGFYLAWDEIMAECRKLGAKEVAGYVMPAHARLLRRVAKRSGHDVEFHEEAHEEAYGRSMVWVRWQL